jgi:hypothetical protein
VIAFLRPDAWDFPLFLHVFGAIVLFGGMATLVLLSFAAQRIPLQKAFAQRLAFITLLAVVWPSYVVMRGGAQWIYNKEDLHPDFPGWIAVGVTVGDGGIIVLLALTALGWLARRRAWAGSFFAGLSALYLVALGVAWWAMSAKPGA